MANFKETTVESIIRLAATLIEQPLSSIFECKDFEKNELVVQTLHVYHPAKGNDIRKHVFVKETKKVITQISDYLFKCNLKNETCKIITIEVDSKDYLLPFKAYFDKNFSSDPSMEACWLDEKNDTFTSIMYDSNIHKFILTFSLAESEEAIRKALLLQDLTDHQIKNNVQN